MTPDMHVPIGKMIGSMLGLRFSQGWLLRGGEVCLKPDQTTPYVVGDSVRLIKIGPTQDDNRRAIELRGAEFTINASSSGRNNSISPLLWGELHSLEALVRADLDGLQSFFPGVSRNEGDVDLCFYGNNVYSTFTGLTRADMTIPVVNLLTSDYSTDNVMSVDFWLHQSPMSVHNDCLEKQGATLYIQYSRQSKAELNEIIPVI